MQPHFEKKETVISNIFFFDGSSGVPLMPANIHVSVGKEVIIRLTQSTTTRTLAILCQVGVCFFDGFLTGIP